MILKIFVKRHPGGDLITNDLEYHTIFVEADKILVSDRGKNQVGFSIVRGGDAGEVTAPTDYCGYEILNSQGTVIDRHISAI